MILYNSLTRKKEDFKVKDNTVRMYVCGPTVYNYFHIGNSRCFIVFDALRRYFEYKGYKVMFAQNFTDVDDKLIKRAAEEGTTVGEVAEKYIKEYFVDAKGLGIRPATFHPRATETIPEIIDFVSTLIEKGHAYATANGDVYFDADSFSEYGKLSHLDRDNLEAGARISINDDKKSPYDFALWKARKTEDEIAWQSPWGMGRPGWHIECSAMVNKLLGTEIDIHGGGPDLIFPHHENEIAQTECATGAPLARFWLHNGYINVDGEKMSKSKGNFFMVRDAAKQYGYRVIRYFILSAHYRSPVNYSEEILRQSAAALERLDNCSDNIKFRLANASDVAMNDSEAAMVKEIAEKKARFLEAMDDDFNTADAIGYLFETVRIINTALKNSDTTKAFISAASEIYFELLGILGFEKEEEADSEAAEIEALIAERAQAKKNKDYAAADAIRNGLKERGIILEDTPQGVKWKRI